MAFLDKGRVLWFQSLFREFILFYTHHNWTSRSRWFALDKVKITYIMKPANLKTNMWKCGSRIFIVYLNLSAPGSTLITFDAKVSMYKTHILKFKLRKYWESKKSNYIHGDRGSLWSKEISYFFFRFVTSLR